MTKNLTDLMICGRLHEAAMASPHYESDPLGTFCLVWRLSEMNGDTTPGMRETYCRHGLLPKTDIEIELRARALSKLIVDTDAQLS
jgi:hypothetical protein